MGSTWVAVQDFYIWALENGDTRTDPWLLVYSPVPVTLIFAVYLIIVAQGPKLMEGREPFTLRSILLIYNLALVGLSAYMFYEFLVTSVLAGYSYLCQLVDYSKSELGLRMARVCWWFFFSKVIELLDTISPCLSFSLRIFFIMRKKFHQISFLHVYHHATMIFNWWAGVKYVARGQAFFIGMFNSFVHIFMYLYYALAVLGPSVQKYLWWKRYLTLLQLTQFAVIALHSGYNLFTDYPFHDGFNIAVFTYTITLIILFLNFYYQTYLRRPHKKNL